MDLRPLTDEEAGEAAGGFLGIYMSAEEKAKVKVQAATDGRRFKIDYFDMLCSHNNDYKWARDSFQYWDDSREGFSIYMRVFHDIKCYKCGKTWASDSRHA